MIVRTVACDDRDPVVAALRSAGCVFAEEEARLVTAAADSPTDLARLVARRVAGEPLEHVLGWTLFCGLRVAVGPGVFVPRRRTALLVREAVRLARATPAPVLVDLCCGSGAVGLAVADALRRSGPGDRSGTVATLVAADVDPAATRCARRNLAGVGEVVTGDLYAALPGRLRGRVDVLVANAPYVPTPSIALLPPEARVHEPRAALDGGADGLDLVRRVAAGAAGWLAPGGHLVVETSEAQAPGVVAAVRAGGLPARVVRARRLGATAVVGGPRPPAPQPTGG